MKKFIIFFVIIVMAAAAFSQPNVYPAPAQPGPVAIVNATIHVGNGTVIDKGTIVFEKGKITYVGSEASVPAGTQQIDGAGKHIYPGLILSSSNLGLREVGSGTRSTNDFAELGDMNPDVQSIVAYNTDSRVINTLRSNGVLLANIVPQGGDISGASSVVQLDAWNWEDALYKRNEGIHFNMPQLISRPNPFASYFGRQQPKDPVKTSLDRIEKVKDFFRAAKAYLQEKKHAHTNLKYEAVAGLFNKKAKLYVHCDLVKEMLVAVDFVKEFGFEVVIVGGSESYLIPQILKENNIAVILNAMHVLPATADDDIDQPFKTPALLQKAGVLFAINDDDGMNRGRNLMFNAGTAVAYGLTKEQALSAITLSAAKILDISEKTGSLEKGKDANIVISEGDILDMRTSVITDAYIQGRKLDLNNKQKELYRRYEYKYGLK